MIVLFFKQYRSWLFFLVCAQSILNMILLLDQGFHHVSVIYFNIVWLIIVLTFLIWRFMKDQQILKNMDYSAENYVEAVKEVYNEQLEYAKADLQQQKLMLLNQQDELLAWVHEMKAPLTASQLLVEQLQNTAIKGRLEAEWLRLYLLLDQQLHSTRLLTIEQDNRMEKFDLQEIVIEEIKALKSWCFDKKIAIDLQNVDVEVISDRKWLGFIIRQILSNAVKYSPIGGEIKLFTQQNNGQRSLFIEDCGIGIKAEDLPRVFRKSYTGTIGRETSAATGMGLYLAKQAAAPLNIVLLIDSIEQKGTTVEIRLPHENKYQQTLS